jgi:AraC-binding-like domain
MNFELSWHRGALVSPHGDTDGQDADRAAWHEALGFAFDWKIDGGGENFAADVTVHGVGPAVLAVSRCSGVSLTRPPSSIERDSLDYFLVQLYRAGTAIGFTNQSPLSIAEGDISIIDLSRPISLTLDAASIITLLLPRNLIEQLVDNPEALHGQILPNGTEANGQLSAQLLALEANATSPTPRPSTSRLRQVVLALADCQHEAVGAESPQSEDWLQLNLSRLVMTDGMAKIVT